jgi:hypothetical protein
LIEQVLLAEAAAAVVVDVKESNSVRFGVWKLLTSDVVEEMSKSKAAMCVV